MNRFTGRASRPGSGGVGAGTPLPRTPSPAAQGGRGQVGPGRACLKEILPMEARLVSHPSADVLRAFGLGKLDDAAAETVLNHLDTCPECRGEVAALSGDSFLDRL